MKSNQITHKEGKCKYIKKEILVNKFSFDKGEIKEENIIIGLRFPNFGIKFPYRRILNWYLINMEIEITQLYQPVLFRRENIYLHSEYIRLVLICIIYKIKFRNKNQRPKTQTLAWEDVA